VVPAGPPDVRKVSDLPEGFANELGYALCWGGAHQVEAVFPVGQSRHRTSDGRAAVARESSLEDFNRAPSQSLGGASAIANYCMLGF